MRLPVLSLGNYFLLQLCLVFAAIAFGACGGTPLAPTASAQSWVPLHHNVPATFVGHPEGPTVWLCATRPRTYLRPTGDVLPDGQPYRVTRTTEEDHYLQYTPCPITPID